MALTLLNLTPPGASSVLSCEVASVIADEIADAAISDTGKALALWLALSHFPADTANSERKSEGRRKAYYKLFLPLFQEGLKSCVSLQVKVSSSMSDERAEERLISEVWKKVCDTLSHILTPVPDATKLQKISRVPEVLEILNLAIDNVPDGACESLCLVLSEGASNALGVEQDNGIKTAESNDGEMNRRRTKYREDALLVFKTCYAGMCKKKAEDPALLSLTDGALQNALDTVNQTKGNTPEAEMSVDSFLMVCEAFQETPGLEGLIVSSFPLLCKLLQTNHDAVRNAAAGALGSADLRQVLSDARARYEEAEDRATRAEKEVAELNKAIAELQRKNEALQQQRR